VLQFHRPSREQVEAFAAAGVDELVLTPWQPLHEADEAVKDSRSTPPRSD
jgi:hypothetical protein